VPGEKGVQKNVFDFRRWPAVLLGGYRGLDLWVDPQGVRPPVDGVHASRNAGPAKCKLLLLIDDGKTNSERPRGVKAVLDVTRKAPASTTVTVHREGFASVLVIFSQTRGS
jgi:hypothetical protein